MHHAMADAADAPARFVLMQPLDQKTQCALVLTVSRSCKFEIDVVQRTAGRIFGLEVCSLAAGGPDAVDLADQFGLLRDRCRAREQRELYRR